MLGRQLLTCWPAGRISVLRLGSECSLSGWPGAVPCAGAAARAGLHARLPVQAAQPAAQGSRGRAVPCSMECAALCVRRQPKAAPRSLGGWRGRGFVGLPPSCAPARCVRGSLAPGAVLVPFTKHPCMPPPCVPPQDALGPRTAVFLSDVEADVWANGTVEALAAETQVGDGLLFWPTQLCVLRSRLQLVWAARLRL